MEATGSGGHRQKRPPAPAVHKHTSLPSAPCCCSLGASGRSLKHRAAVQSAHLLSRAERHQVRLQQLQQQLARGAGACIARLGRLKLLGQLELFHRPGVQPRLEACRRGEADRGGPHGLHELRQRDAEAATTRAERAERAERAVHEGLVGVTARGAVGAPRRGGRARVGHLAEHVRYVRYVPLLE